MFFLGWESRRLSLALAVFLKARPGLAPLEVSGQNPIDVSRTWVWAIITGKTHSLKMEKCLQPYLAPFQVKNKKKKKKSISQFTSPAL